jgi:hypothetical protein
MVRLNVGEVPFFRQELVLEFGFWIAVLLLSAILLATRPGIFQRLEVFGKTLARKRGLAVALVILAALGLRAILLIQIPRPDPEVHDEYSYLLQAATFASGRVTNPTPAAWEHFETFHVNMRPTYQSMYPPAQALILAAAEIVRVHPWWSIWLSVGFMCGAICWMLQGWVPPQWALLGGLFCVIRFSTFSYWANTYLGGPLAAIGGALVLGSLPRLKRHPRARYGVLFALGLALLANSRPYEGFIFSLPPIVVFLKWLFGAWKRREAKNVFVPAASVLVVVTLAMGYYNWRGTGDPLLMPYVSNQAQYHVTKPFIWQTRYAVPEYRHQVMRTFYVIHELPDYLNRANPDGLATLLRRPFNVYYEFYIWPMLIPTVFALWAMMKSQRMRLFSIMLLWMVAGLVLEQWAPQAQYAAPVLGLAIGVVIYGLRLTWTWQPRGIPLGPMLVRSAVLSVFVLALSALVLRLINPFGLKPDMDRFPENLERTRLESQLERTPGQHLVLVHVRRSDRGSIFWIYNEPDLNHAKIIWAHDMGDTENQELIRLYPNRRVWMVDKDNAINRLVPYAPSPQLAGFTQNAYLGEAHAQQ